MPVFPSMVSFDVFPGIQFLALVQGCKFSRVIYTRQFLSTLFPMHPPGVHPRGKCMTCVFTFHVRDEQKFL